MKDKKRLHDIMDAIKAIEAYSILHQRRYCRFEPTALMGKQS
jgi:hypothetical protein